MRLIMTVTFNNPFSLEDPSVLRMRLRDLELFMRAGGKQSSALGINGL